MSGSLIPASVVLPLKVEDGNTLNALTAWLRVLVTVGMRVSVVLSG